MDRAVAEKAVRRALRVSAADHPPQHALEEIERLSGWTMQWMENRGYKKLKEWKNASGEKLDLYIRAEYVGAYALEVTLVLAGNRQKIDLISANGPPGDDYKPGDAKKTLNDLQKKAKSLLSLKW